MTQIAQQGAINTTALIVPDLYVQIVAPQVSQLNGVPTNVLGIVGTATWGPVNAPVDIGDMAAYARQCKRLGEVGAGQLTKMVNQICIAGIVQGLSEGLSFARAAGLDAEAVIEVISKGAAQSWQMENRHKTMLANHFEHGFAVEWMRKDLGIVLDEARNNGASLPVAALVDQFYADVENMGGKRWDTSSLIKRL